MAHTLTGTDAYPISAATVPDDGDDADAASVDVGFQAHENAIATLAARLGGKTTGLTTEWSYPSEKGRSTRIPAVGGSALPVYVNTGTGFSTAVDANLWRPHYLVAAGGGVGGRDLVSATGKVYTGLTLHEYVRPIKEFLMPGGTIVTVEVRVSKGTAQATSTSRMGWAFYKVNLAGTRTDIASGTANSSSGDETISVTLGTPEVVDATTNYYISVFSSVGAGGTVDYFLGANINWTDPGPRN